LNIAYDKLVRDKIPEIIEAAGKKAVTRKANDAEYPNYLKKKLQEEVEEFLKSGESGELADILEVLIALGNAKGIGFDELLELAAAKRKNRGGFQERIILVSVEEEENI
jgi:predicted house-cleaning noncanonical NTP pyrophosphatase (MazG superfamily)